MSSQLDDITKNRNYCETLANINLFADIKEGIIFTEYSLFVLLYC
jgi:hypothetical protein